MINMHAPSLLQQSPSARCALAKPCPCKPSLALHNRLHGRGRAGDSRVNGHRVMTRAVESPDTDSQSSSPAERQNQLYNYRISVEEDDEPTSCSPSFVSVNNTAHEKWTILDVDVADYPGLIRTISWVLNGMEMRVQNATLQTKDGWAHDVFWLSTWGGKKLTDKQAALAAERVQDFVVFCEPKKCTPTEWGLKNLHISNADHPDWTVLVIEGEPKRQGFVLELASVLGGTGTQVQEAYIQSEPIENKEPAPEGSPPQPVAVAPPDYDFSKGRYFKFFLSDEAGHKLDSSRIGAILFTYDVFTDSRHMPLVAPNMDSYLRRQEQEGCA